MSVLALMRGLGRAARVARAGGWRTLANSPMRLEQVDAGSLPASAQDYLYREKVGSTAFKERLPSKNLKAVEQTAEQRALWNTLKECMASSDWEGAMEVYRQVPNEVDISWQPVMRTILNCLCRSFRWREATEVFERFPERDTMAYNMYLNLLARLKHSRQFDKTLQRMEEENVPQSSVTICSIMSMCKETNDWQQAIELLDGLKSDTDPEGSAEVPYLLAMTACARARAKDKAAELLQEAKNSPNFQVKCSHYNALMMACGTDHAAARAVFQQLKADGLEPSGPDWRALMLSARADLEVQRAVYQEMRAAAPSDPPGEALAILLRGAVMEDNAEAIDWVMEEMSGQRYAVDSAEAQRVPSLRRAIQDLRDWQSSQRLKPAAGQQSQQAEQDATVEAAPKAAEAVTGEGGLPVGWQSTLDPSSGQTYYWHVDNPAGTTTWDRPS